MLSDISHSQILQWTVSFVLAVLVIILPPFWVMVRSLKKFVKISVDTLQGEVKGLDRHINEDVKAVDRQLTSLDAKIESVSRDLDKRKLEVSLYVADKEAAAILTRTLQTRDACQQLKNSCADHIADKLSGIQTTMDRLITNQKETSELKGTVIMLIERVEHQIERIDRHINGTSKK